MTTTKTTVSDASDAAVEEGVRPNMPMDRARYPKNWEAIAAKVKSDANWTCQECGRPCRKPGEHLIDFAARIASGKMSECPNVFEALEYPQRFTLTTAHLDQNPSNNDPSNLKALCSGCHLKYDAPFRAANQMAKRERAGQMRLEVS